MQINRLLNVGVLATFFLSTSAISAPVFNIENILCNGIATPSTADLSRLSCAGDLLINNGSITSDTTIALTADGSITLNDVRLTAPIVNLTTQSGPLNLGAGVLFATSAYSLNAPLNAARNGRQININPLATVTLNGAAPVRIVANGVSSTTSVSVPTPSTLTLFFIVPLALFGANLFSNNKDFFKSRQLA